jgi:hypothetical protein
MTRRTTGLGLQVLVATMFAGLLGGALSGCFEQEEPTCEYWVPKLTSASKSDKALTMVEELKCKEALPTLEQLFDEGHQRTKIIRIVKLIDDRAGATGIIKKALKKRETVKLAAGIVVDWKLDAAKGELVEILTKDNMTESRETALKALLTIDKATNHEDALIKLAGADMNMQGPAVNAQAIEELGNMRSAKAIPTLIRAAFMRTTRGAKVYQGVRKAMAQIGPAVLEPLLETVHGKNEELKKYCSDNGIFEWEWSTGPEIVQMLSDTLDERVAEPLVTSLRQNIAEPVGLSPANAEAWRRAQINRLTTIMLGLGHVGSAKLDPLLALVKDKDADAINQRLKAASIIAYVGGKVAQKALLDLWVEQEETNCGKKTGNSGDCRRWGLIKGPLVFPIAEALDHEGWEEFEKILGKKVEGQVQENLDDPRVKVYVAAIKECKLEADCWMKKLSSADKWEQVKASLMLARGIGDRAEVEKALITVFSKTTKDLIDQRRFPLMALTRIGDAETGKKLVELGDQQDPTDRYWPGELYAFGYHMMHGKK